jgi:hypothetical protein
MLRRGSFERKWSIFGAVYKCGHTGIYDTTGILKKGLIGSADDDIGWLPCCKCHSCNKRLLIPESFIVRYADWFVTKKLSMLTIHW